MLRHLLLALSAVMGLLLLSGAYSYFQLQPSPQQRDLSASDEYQLKHAQSAYLECVRLSQRDDIPYADLTRLREQQQRRQHPMSTHPAVMAKLADLSQCISGVEDRLRGLPIY